MTRRLGAGFRQFAPLGFRQVLVFLPFLFDSFLLVGRQFIDLLEILACQAAFLLRQPGPSAHLRLQALLLLDFHRGIAFGNQYPFIAPEIRKRVEVLGEGCQDFLLLAIELHPLRRGVRCYGERGNGES